MNPDRWKQIEEIYHRAQQRDAPARSDFLDEACAGDVELRDQVESLFNSGNDADSFLNTPAMNPAARMIADEPTPSLAGKQISRYKIVEQIGAGGMGEVYRAIDVRLVREVAIKVLPASLSKNTEAVARFEREARAVAALSHPNILAIHDFGTEQKVCYAVTELLEGETLRSRLLRKSLGWREAVEIALAVAEGLSAAHAKGIVHRDLKPENLFVTTDGRVKILDFGLAKLKPLQFGQVMTEAPTQPLTEPGVVMGTVGYMSPEQVRGEKVDAPSDLFSLGCVLHEMLTGRRAFARETAAETMAAILRDEPPKLSESSKVVPPELERVITRCLKKKADERYPSARDLISDLKATLTGLEVSSTAPPFGIRKLRPAIIATAALTLLLVIALAYWLTSGSQRAEQARGSRPAEQSIDSIVVLPLVNVTGDADTEYLSEGIAEDLINSLSRLSKPRVIARSTAFRFKGSKIDPVQIGRELNVHAVFAGRMTLRGDTLTVQADLTDVASGTQLWGEQFNKKLGDIFIVQEEIARRISEGLHLKLTGAEQQQLARRYTDNVTAYQLYLKGRFWAFKFSEEGMQKAREYFQQAIQLDRSFALAYAGLAEYHIIYYDPTKAAAAAKDAAVKALELDETLTEAHYSLALVSGAYEWNWTKAEQEYLRAIELSPGSASAHDWYGWYLAQVGRTDEAIDRLRLAQHLSPHSVHINTNLGRAYYWGRKWDRAIEQFLTALELDPNFWMARIFLGLAYEQQAKYEQAVAEFRKSSKVFPEAPAYVGHGLAVSGKMSEARKVLNDYSRSKSPTSWALATLYAGLGDRDQAFAWLEKAAQERFVILASLKVDPVFDPLRSDTRFDSLLQRIGL